VRHSVVAQNKEIKLAEKTNQQNAIVRFYRETIGELKKVSWPTRTEAIHLTIIVVFVLILMAAILGFVDAAGFYGLDLILRK
jgi:preprotein translocase subunit SecE